MRSLFTLNYLILAFNFETFLANLVSKYKQAKRDCRTARSWSTRHCNKQDSAKTEASSSMSLPSNVLLYETDSKFHERLAAHRLLSPDKIHINFANYFETDRYAAYTLISSVEYLWNICKKLSVTYLRKIGIWPHFHICHRYVTDIEQR